MQELNKNEIENINGGGFWNDLEHIGTLYLGAKSAISRGGSIDFLPWSVMSPAERQEAFEPGGSDYC